jgi:hypothetical protein
MGGVRTRLGPLLAELHAHTTWSDGAFSVGQLVDIYGERGFDVLCITDHVCRPNDPWLEPTERHERGVRAEVYGEYLAELDREAERARTTYGLLLLPGLELTWNDLDPDEAAHALAVGLRRWTSLEGGIEAAMASAAAAGAAIVAAHPYEAEPAPSPSRLTRRFARHHERLAPLVHRWELFNRTTLFSWVAAAGLPAVATGDFHRLEHLPGWKTLLPCAKDEETVIAFLRSQARAHLTVFEPAARPLAA